MGVRLGGGGREAGERGEVATRKFKQTNTATPRPPLPAPLGQKLCGRMRGAAAGPAAWTPNEAGGGGGGDRGRSPGPQPRTGEGRAPALRAKVSEPSGCGLDSCFRIYLYIYPLAPPPSPLLLFSTPSFSDHTRSSRTRQLSHSRPPPGRSGEGRRNLLGCGGRSRGDKGVAGSGGGEGRAIRRVSCAEVLVVARAGGGGGGEWDVMDSDFSFIHEEGRGPGRKAAEDQ